MTASTQTGLTCVSDAPDPGAMHVHGGPRCEQAALPPAPRARARVLRDQLLDESKDQQNDISNRELLFSLFILREDIKIMQTA